MKLGERIACKHVARKRHYSPVIGCGRSATCYCPKSELIERIGEPSAIAPTHEKVKIMWSFSTPAGPAELTDYWWNAKGYEWSIRGSTSATRWLCAYLRGRGIRYASRHFTRDDDTRILREMMPQYA